MKFYILFIPLLVTAMVESKPLNSTRDFEISTNEIHDGIAKKTVKPMVGENRKKNAIPEKDDSTRQRAQDVIPEWSTKGDVNGGENKQQVTNQQYNPFPSLLSPLLQRLQFSPQTLFQDRLNLLRDGLVSFGIVLPDNNATTSKQLPTSNGLLNLIGLNDAGFYTDRLEPVGFLGGNGWFANKGGILGGPGAIYSTGSLFTDYPTAYKK